MDASIIEPSLAAHPRVSPPQLPTPWSPLSRLSRHDGRRLLRKHDDLTGFSFGGNKTRKLE